MFESLATIAAHHQSTTVVILDSGSTDNIINNEFVMMTGLSVIPRKVVVTMAPNMCVVSFPLVIGNHSKVIQALVMPCFSYFLLGIDIDKLFPIVVDLE